MSYSVVLSDEAAKVLLRTDAKLRARLQNRLHQLAENSFDPRLSAPLTNRHGVRKSRVGDWRILFAVDRQEKLVQSGDRGYTRTGLSKVMGPDNRVLIRAHL